MKKLVVLTLLVLLPLVAGAQPSRSVKKANYELAERFSQKKVGQMVYSTQIRPNWFRNSDRFWYSWKTSQGTRYYVVDAVTGVKTELFDMDRLAMQVSEITRDPYDAAHLPLNSRRTSTSSGTWSPARKSGTRPEIPPGSSSNTVSTMISAPGN